jgi:hypothetical protein
LHQVVAAEAVDGRWVRVAFENAIEGMFDCAPYMKDKYWAKLAEPAFFRQVRVAWGTLCWPGLGCSGAGGMALGVGCVSGLPGGLVADVRGGGGRNEPRLGRLDGVGWCGG